MKILRLNLAKILKMRGGNSKPKKNPKPSRNSDRIQRLEDRVFESQRKHDQAVKDLCKIFKPDEVDEFSAED